MLCETLEARRLLASYLWTVPSTNPHTGSPPTSVTLKQGPDAGKVNAFLNGNTNLNNPDHEFTNTTGTDIIQVQSGVSGFLFVDQVPAALKPGESDPFAEDGGIQVQGGSDNILRIEAAADDTDIVVDPNSSTTSGAVIVNGVRSRFATGVNRIVIRTNDAGFARVEVTSLADNLFLEVDTGQGTDVTMTFGFDDTIHEQVTVKTGAGDDIINIEPNNGDDGADVLVDFVYATQLGLGNELNVYSAGSATLANAPGTSGGTRYVDQVNVRGSGTTTRGGVTV
ncbi:hypothetical protein [Fontivita pretiosa]|uniref:hypothetical protein n=1 Tax=Fontivita pretiosa TaxID=2989684 RepID=UPI003D16A480